MTDGKTIPADPRSRQKRRGELLREATRVRLLDAAAGEFGARGYAGTTVARLAESAGVSVQTLYLAWGSKRALLRAYVERTVAGGAATPADAIDRFAGLAPRERLAELADLVVEIAERAAVGWAVYREGAAVDPGIASDWDELQQLRRGLVSQVVEGIPRSVLRAGLARAEAADVVWAITGPGSYDLLVSRLGYTLEQFRVWMRRTLVTAVLRPS